MYLRSRLSRMKWCLMEDGPLTEELYQMIATLEKRYPALRVCPLRENVQLGRALAKGVEMCTND